MMQHLAEAQEIIGLVSATGKPLVVNFSGGKDSTALVALVLDMVSKGLLNPTNITIYHSDTTIEYPILADFTHKILSIAKKYINVVIGVATPEKRLFAGMFGYGRPVPSHFTRWCTDDLKIKPGLAALGKDCIRLTGEHKGESAARDKRLSTCGGSECGSDRLSNFLTTDNICKPIVNWSNCQVWDYLFLAEYQNGLFYPGFFNELSRIYEIANDDEKNTSLRMGCISCPVVNTTRSYSTEHKGVPDKLSLKLRLFFEVMRGDENRVKNPRPPKNGTRQMGALALPIRKFYWGYMKDLNKEFSDIGVTLISSPEVAYIEENLVKGTYPVTYKPEKIVELEKEWYLRNFELCQALGVYL